MKPTWGLCLAIVVAAATAGAAEQNADPVVAIAGGMEIHAGEVTFLYESLGPNVRQMPFDVLYLQLLDGVIESRLVAAKARATGLDRDPEVLRKIGYWTERVLEETFINRSVEAGITDQAMKDRYEATVGGLRGQSELQVSQMLFQKEADAIAAIKQLDAGIPFKTLVQRLTTGPNPTVQAGDIDWFKKGDVIKEFEDAAFKLANGEYTTTPLKTQFGFHVLTVTARRPVAVPTFDEVKGDIRDEIGKEVLDKLYAGLTAGLEIKKFQMDGTALPPPRDLNAAQPTPVPVPAPR